MDSSGPAPGLPVQLTSFVGRQREIAELTQALASSRLLTLTGTGGIGKTRLATAVGSSVYDSYAGGVWVVELASLAEPDLVAHTVAETLGLRETPGQAVVDTLVMQLAPKHTLLVLDNCEHVIDACAVLAERLLRACPRLQVMATSRRALGIAGETVWRVPALGLPDASHQLGTDELAGCEAVHLFLDRARLVRPGFVLEDRTAAAVVGICRELEGVPLAIELAAARVSVLAVEQIAERLRDRLRLLVSAHRTGSARQRTLRGTLDWSFDLLSATEQRFLARLSVFAGGWTLEAAEAVGSGGDTAAADVLELVARLVEQSLVLADEEAVGERRYRLLETVRQYAREKLDALGELRAVQDRHRDWYVEFARTAERELDGPRQANWFERLAVEHDNLRAAMTHCLATDPGSGLALAASLTWFWLLRGHVPEGREWLEALLQRSNAAPSSPALAAAQAAALNAAGYLAVWLDDHPAALAHLEEGLALWRRIGDRKGEVEAVCSLAIAAHRRGDDPGELLEQCLSGWRAGGAAPVPCYITLSDIAELVRGRGDHDRAVRLNEESLKLASERGDNHGVAYAIRCLGHLVWQAGDYARARDLHCQSLTLAWQLNDRLCSARCLEELALVASAQGEAERAAQLFGVATAWWAVMGVRLLPVDRADHERGVQSARSRLPDDVFQTAWTRGSALSAAQAVELALSTGTVPLMTATAAPSGGPLTAREQEVAALVARGLTNYEIAERLVITRRTAEAHVTHILSKLGLRSRAQIALWAAQHGLVKQPSA
jgi:non-specific serine/threonine protein kinase